MCTGTEWTKPRLSIKQDCSVLGDLMIPGWFCNEGWHLSLLNCLSDPVSPLTCVRFGMNADIYNISASVCSQSVLQMEKIVYGLFFLYLAVTAAGLPPVGFPSSSIAPGRPRTAFQRLDDLILITACTRPESLPACWEGNWGFNLLITVLRLGSLTTVLTFDTCGSTVTGENQSEREAKEKLN